jgi:uncharacterized linocin/CFP29 family protein
VSHLLREKAPITEAGWGLIDEEAASRLKVALAARRLVDFNGPKGWTYSATNLGRASALAGSLVAGIAGAQRSVLPLVELRAGFAVAREELRAADRGAEDVDLDALDEAALNIALAENIAVFHGWQEAGIAGIAEASTHDPLPLGDAANLYPGAVARGAERLLRAGIPHPYGLALGPECYRAVVETTEHGGYPVFEHLEHILGGGPLVRAPGVRGAVLLSMRGGDFLFESGQDLSIGYASHNAEAVQLYLEESFSFRVATPEAAIALTTS